MSRRWTMVALGLAIGLGAQGSAHAEEPELTWTGRVQSDLRLRPEADEVGQFYNKLELPSGVARNQNLVGTTINLKLGDVGAVADIDLALYGFSRDFNSIGDLALREQVDPYRIDVHQLYVEVKNLAIDGLDLRVGQQLVQWGVGDQFNPTNNLNADNVEDALRFGDQLGNAMVRVDYWINEEWSLTGVLVPVFKPALLPRTGPLGTARVDRIPLTDAFLRHRIEAENASVGGSLLGYPTTVSNVTPELPSTSFENMQAGYRIGGTIAEQEISLSYYLGRTDFPQPMRNHAVQDKTPRCNPDQPSECVRGLLGTEVTVGYPRMHVYGFNLAGEIGWLKELSDVFNAIGYRMEGALVVPQRSTLQITNGQLDLVFPQPAGEYDYNDDGRPGGPEPAVVDATPFLKWVVGLDYSFGEHVMVIAQWVHGFVDEYGAGDFIHEGWTVLESGVTTDDTTTTLSCALPRDGTTCAREVLRPRLGDYLVAILDLKFLDSKALLRVLGILYLNGVREEYWDPVQQQRVSDSYSMFTSEGFSAVIYPEFNYNFGNGLELGAGGLVMLGNRNSKFGDPQTGGTLVWTRGRYSF
jgi:hypothetical protein